MAIITRSVMATMKLLGVLLGGREHNKTPKASLFALCLREHRATLPPGSKQLALTGGFWVDCLLERFTVKLMTVRRSGP